MNEVRQKFLGFNGQQYGDLVMNTVAARSLKELYPKSELTLVVNKDYADIVPIFYNHPYIDKFYVTHRNKDGFDEEDIKWVKQQKFDHVFNPMQDHSHESPWYRVRHQAQELCHMHGLPIPKNIQCELIRWFEVPDNKKYVAFSPFPAFYAGIKNDKAYSIEKAQKIVDFIRSLGLEVLQIGHPDEPQLKNVLKPRLSYFDCVKYILASKFWIGGDTGMCWLLSAYQFPVLACYSNRYYTKEFVKNIQPINANSIYLDAPSLNDIDDEMIFTAISGMNQALSK